MNTNSPPLREKKNRETVSAASDELAAAVAMLQMLSARNNKGAGGAITPQPAQESKSNRYPAQHSTNLYARN
jgi:hypothetical protein